MTHVPGDRCLTFSTSPRGSCARLALSLIALMIAGAGLAQAQQTRDRRVAIATFTAERIMLDGVLDEPAWQTAVSVGAFIQKEPVEGATPTEPTDVRILYDKDHLYI